MESKYFPPIYNQTHFHCPYCNVNANQLWCSVRYVFKNGTSGNGLLEDMETSYCSYCKSFSYWYKEELLFPHSSLAPLPHPDLPETIKGDYLEARSIVNKSPRGAAALLRLALQKLMVELGEKGKKIDDDISSLVKKGLPIEVQQALDILRVIGNESVHPGELNLKDDQDTAIQLFDLINFVVEDQMTRKKKIAAFYDKLPEGKRKYIEQRDNPKT